MSVAGIFADSLLAAVVAVRCCLVFLLCIPPEVTISYTAGRRDVVLLFAVVVIWEMGMQSLDPERTL